jgi:uroporphyrinogen decarboxylase
MSVSPEVLQRVTDAIHFRQPDRVPIWEALENQAVYDHFAPGVPFPQCAAIACEKLGIDATYGCMPAVTDERVEGNVVRAGQTLWHTQPTFRSLEDLRGYDPPRVNPRELEARILANHQAMQELYGPRVLYLPQSGGWGFLPGYDAETFTVVATALAEDLPALERFWDINVERAIARNSVAARHKLAPVIQCCEDVAYKTGLMVSPDILRGHFFPRFAQVIAPLKQAGIKVIWHSDGNIMEVLDDAIAAGIDGINPLDPSAGMDIGAIRRKYGRRLILVGNVGRKHVLRWGTPEQVRQEVRECISAAGPGGGHVLQCGDGQVMPDIPLANVLAYLDEARGPGGRLVP